MYKECYAVEYFSKEGNGHALYEIGRFFSVAPLASIHILLQ